MHSRSALCLLSVLSPVAFGVGPCTLETHQKPTGAHEGRDVSKDILRALWRGLKRGTIFSSLKITKKTDV